MLVLLCTRTQIPLEFMICFPKSEKPTLIRLICFHHAGGGASAFRGWREYLPSGVDVCPVQLPGREDRLREKPYRQMVPLVRNLAEELETYLNQPFAFRS